MKKIIDTLVQDKLDDGQLNDCRLDLKEIEIKSNKKIEFYKSKANFIFGRSRIKDILKEVFEQNGVLARYFNDDSFRLTVGSPMENDLIVNIIENIIYSLGESYEEIVTD